MKNLFPFSLLDVTLNLLMISRIVMAPMTAASSMHQLVSLAVLKDVAKTGFSVLFQKIIHAPLLVSLYL